MELRGVALGAGVGFDVASAVGGESVSAVAVTLFAISELSGSSTVETL